MRKVAGLLTISLLISCTGVSWLSAESTPEALEWIGKMKGAYEKSYRVNYTAVMNLNQSGQSIGMIMKGSTLQADRRHMRMELDVQMSMGGMKMEIEMLGIAAGDTFWVETDNPMMGGKQVMKMPADKLGEMAEGMGMAGGANSLDPVGQIEQMTELFDFDLDGVADGRVVLRAVMTEEAVAELSSVIPQAEGVKEFVLVLDEKTAFPVEMQMGGQPPLMEMTFSDLEFLERDAMDPGLFLYTPPEGVRVMDLGELGSASGP